MSQVLQVPSPRAVLEARTQVAREREVPTGRLLHCRQQDWQERNSVPEWARPIIFQTQSWSWTEQIHWVSSGERDLRCYVHLWEPTPVQAQRSGAMAQEWMARAEPDVRIACSSPTVVLLDDGRLHSADGHAIEWSDGTGWYCLRGVPIDDGIWRRWKSGTLRGTELLALENQAVASVLLEQIGWRDLMHSKGGSCVHEVLDHHDRWGTLHRFTWTNARRRTRRWEQEQTAMVLEVVNRSPEPDGSFRHYWLQCDERLRRLLPTGPEWGTDQPLTARNAVASTWGMLGPEYEAMLGEES